MEAVTKIRQEIGPYWIPDIYVNRIRPLRTRSFEMEIPERENRPEIVETLLGWELKVGRLRIACPNIATARYLQVFARIGCGKVAVPYDITAIPLITDDLEQYWLNTVAAIDSHSSRESPQQKGKIRASVIRAMREGIEKAGAGELMPLFNRSTKQRKT